MDPAKLNVNDALAKKYLPRIKERCQTLSRVNGFTWRTLPTVELLDGILEDLAKGAVPLKRYAGQGLAFGYWSETMQRLHDDTDETVYLCLRREDRAVCIERINGRWVRSMVLELGA